jgi:hypothetical protein
VGFIIKLMAKQRYINTKFWSDNFISELNPLDRYLFLYFLTNEHTNIAGIYEVPLKTVSFETGIEIDMLKKMIKRLFGKIFYIDGWICIKNFQKHQSINDSIKKGIKISIEAVPSHIIKEFDRLCTGCVQAPTYLNLNLNLNSNLNYNIVAKSDDGALKNEEKEFSHNEELEKLRTSTRKDYKIIALYWKKKNWKFENKEQYNSALVRELKPAKNLKGYTGEQIGKSITFCMKEYPEIWTLETVFKRIQDLVNRQNG